VRSPDNGDDVHVYERQYGAFVRRFTLPAQADKDNIQAELDDGVLRLNIPKKEEAKPRKLSLTERIKKKIKA
jgi:HSP20 family protein